MPRKRSGVRGVPEPLSPDRRRTLVVLPTYEERDTIEWVLARLLDLPERVDVLVVDDASPDGTGRLVEAVAADEPRVRLLERSRKSGLASAYLDGFRVGVADGYDLLVEMDSDLSHQPEELSRMLEAAARVATWSWGAGTSRAAPSPTGAAPAWRCPRQVTRTRV